MSQPCGARARVAYPFVCYSRRVLLAILLVAAPAEGSAAEARRGARSRQSAAALAEAARLLALGQQALAQRDFPSAERTFTEAYLKAPAPQPLYFLGLCAAQQGQLLVAQDLLRRFEADPAAEPDPAALGELRRLLDQPVPLHGKAQILGEPGAVVRVDGRLIGALPLLAPVLLAPQAAHTLTLETRGQSIPATVTVPAGRFVEVRINAASRGALITLLPAYVALTRIRGAAGALTPGLTASLGRALEEGLTAEKRSVLSRELSLSRAPELKACLERPACQQKLAEKNDAEGVFQIDVEPSTAGGRYRMRVQLLDTGTGDIAVQSESERTEAELSGALRQAVVQAATEVAQRPRGTVAVITEPPGAEVYVDDKPLGRAPLERAVWAGRHLIALRKPGHEEIRRTFELTDGQSVNIREILPQREPEPQPPRAVVFQTELVRRPRPTWRLVVGGIGIGAGIVIGGVGLSGLSTHGLCVSGVTPECSLRYNTLTPGLSMTIVGGVLALGGALTAGLPEPLRPIDTFALEPAANPAAPPPQ